MPIDPTSLKYSRVTDLKAGTCNHIDFMVLYLAFHGPTRASELDRAHSAWLGKAPTYRYFACAIFGAQFGYISKSFTNLSSAIRPPCYGFGTNKKTLFHKPTRGVYAINARGVDRLGAILSRLHS